MSDAKCFSFYSVFYLILQKLSKMSCFELQNLFSEYFSDINLYGFYGNVNDSSFKIFKVYIYEYYCNKLFL